jgi:signal transduction histidine kinase
VTAASARRPSNADLALGGALAALMLGEFATESPDIAAPGLVAALLVVMGLAVATRNVAPFASFLVNGLALVAVIALGFAGSNYQWTNLLCLYTVADRCRMPLSLGALVLGELGVTAWFLLTPDNPAPVIQVFVMLTWIVGWAAGTQVAARRHELARQREHGAEAAARHDAETRATVAEERAQMARELHDSIGHSVTLMVMQAGAARRSIDRDTTTAVAAIEVVEHTGRAALGELDRLVGLLHRDRDAVEDPVPGLDDLAPLAERTAMSGLRVDLDVDVDAARVPRTVQLGVFRVVQEALTNTLKHAGARHARVDVHLDDDRVVAAVYDDGRGAADVSDRPDGRGLIGLAARIAVLGGTFEHGPRPEGGYRVACKIPLS